MKIINLDKFRDLPPYTLFSKYKPCVLGDLEIKGDTLDVDFLSQEIANSVEAWDTAELVSKLENATESGISVDVDLDSWGRDGLFESDQLFAVWEKKDIEKLIAVLNQCLHNAHGQPRLANTKKEA